MYSGLILIIEYYCNNYYVYYCVSFIALKTVMYSGKIPYGWKLYLREQLLYEFLLAVIIARI